MNFGLSIEKLDNYIVRRKSMRVIKYFCSNKQVGNLLQRFKISQDNLYHYTSKDASIEINKGEIWITRADCFLDSREISHGIQILSGAANNYLAGNTKNYFVNLLSVFQSTLKNTYVMSLSQDSANQYLKNNYAANGAIIEFKWHFPEDIGAICWHSIPTSNDSHSIHHLSDLYSYFEGFVVYDGISQRDIARSVCEAYRDIRSSKAHFVDEIHFANVLTQCVVLFKEESYTPEKEYRIALIRNDNSSNPFLMLRYFLLCANNLSVSI